MGLGFKQRIKRNLPQSVLRVIRSWKNRHYNNIPLDQVFTKIYESGAWGRSPDPNRRFYSGSGSARDEERSAYVVAVDDFLRSLATKQDVVDLGCGDFQVGSQIRESCRNYIACDVVPSLIEFNKETFKDRGVEFRTLDLTKDELPAGNIAFVRQVLQHLSNEHIQRFVARVTSTYQYLIVTEHLPSSPIFKPNLDKPSGPGTRMGYDSGVVLTAPPFNLRPRSERQLCVVDSVDAGTLVTTLYEL
jgi:SAM-dependent methyltransferase